MPIDPSIEFLKNKGELYNCLGADNCNSHLELWANKKKGEGLSKQEIFTILLECHKSIQTEPDPGERKYDCISNFLDRFTAWGKHNRIWPEEPDISNFNV
jgi:hypothetical protein